jgi:hypothetical protein
VQNADSSSLFDDLDAALQSGSSEKRVVVLRQVTDLARILARHSEIGIAGPTLTTSIRLGSPEIVKALTKSSVDDGLSVPCKARLLRFWRAQEVSARSA